MVRPSENEETIQHMDNFPSICFRGKFIDDIMKCKQKILQKLSTKSFFSQSLNCKQFLAISQTFLKHLNDNKLPNLQVTYK